MNCFRVKLFDKKGDDRESLSLYDSLEDVKENVVKHPERLLEFGVSLDVLYSRYTKPPNLKKMLFYLYNYGNDCMHLFGVTPDESLCRKLKDKLIKHAKVKLKKQSIYTIAAVFRNFLQKLPDCLLCTFMYDDWMENTMSCFSYEDRERAKKLILQLPYAHTDLLICLLLILRRICKFATNTQTNPILAGYLIGPYLLWRPKIGFDPNPKEEERFKMALVIKMLIVHFDYFFNHVDEEKIFPIKMLDKGPCPDEELYSCSSNILQSSINYGGARPNHCKLHLAKGNVHFSECVTCIREDGKVSVTKLRTSSDTGIQFKKRKKWNLAHSKSELSFSINNEVLLRNVTLEPMRISPSEFPSWINIPCKLRLLSNALPKSLVLSGFTMNLNDLSSKTAIKANTERKFYLENQTNSSAEEIKPCTMIDSIF